MVEKKGEIMHDIITAQQLTETFELLEPTQKQTVDEFMTFLLSRHRVYPIQEGKQLLLDSKIGAIFKQESLL